MLINDVRALAYTARISWVRPIAGADNIELVGIGGWTCIAKIGEFHEGDICVYFEIDSKLPSNKEWCAFMESKKFKVKTMKLSKFGVVSQGLALPINVFDIEIPNEENIDLTEKLGVTYADAEDNQRKAPSIDKYKKMVQRRPNLFRRPIVRWFMRREWGRRMMFVLFGKKKDKSATAFPNHLPFITKSDEERCENIPHLLENKTPWIKTVKIDGTSSLYLLERKKKKNEYWVCSRNVRQLTPEQPCYHSDNVYWSVDKKYAIRDFLEEMLRQHPEWEYVAIQGEIAGVGEDGGKIQGDPHKFGELRFFAYNFIDSQKGRWNSVEAKNLVQPYGIEWVPIVDENYILPDDFEEFKKSADGLCEAPGASGLREGYVYRNVANPNLSFKNVSRQYLLKHGQ